MTTTYSQSDKCFRSQLRPAWTGTNIALMVLGFVFFFPVGLFMLAYMIWGEQWGLDLSNWGSIEKSVNRAGDSVKSTFSHKSAHGTTGNRAFDDWRATELDRLEKERRKLDEARREFDDYVEELRRARDRKEFDEFYSKWQSRPSTGSQDDIIDVEPDEPTR